MFKIFRMVFAIVAAIFVALCVPAGIFWDMIAVWACAGGALLFFALSMLFKYFQEEREKDNNPAPASSADTASDTSDAAATEAVHTDHHTPAAEEDKETAADNKSQKDKKTDGKHSS